MAINWFKKKKGAQEEPEDAEQKTDEDVINTRETGRNTEVRPLESDETAEDEKPENKISTSPGIENQVIDRGIP